MVYEILSLIHSAVSDQPPIVHIFINDSSQNYHEFSFFGLFVVYQQIILGRKHVEKERDRMEIFIRISLITNVTVFVYLLYLEDNSKMQHFLGTHLRLLILYQTSLNFLSTTFSLYDGDVLYWFSTNYVFALRKR